MATVELSPSFDYTALDATTRAFVQQRAGAIHKRIKRTAEDLVATGLDLIEVKRRLGHGQFGLWLKTEFGWHHNTALNFMRVADRFGDNHKICDFAPSALYMLSAPSVPEEARQEALSLAANGQPVTHADSKRIVEKHRPATPQSVPTPVGGVSSPSGPSLREVQETRREQAANGHPAKPLAPPASRSADGPPGFAKLWETISRFLISLPRRGGIAHLLRNSPRTVISGTYGQMQSLRELVEQALTDLEEAYPWLDRKSE